MQVKLLHNLVEEMAGEGTGRIVEILFGKKDVNEFLIAKKMDLTINQVRNILYKLSADGLVSFIRKKDKRKGWYIYYWTIKTEKCMEKLESSLVSKIENFKHVLHNRQTKRYYVCVPCGIEVGEEKALEHGFSCEECAEVYELANNTGQIRETKAKITRTKNNLILIREELEKIRIKKSRKRARANKKAEKIVAEKKALMKEIRAAARAKINKEKRKAGGKVVKKAVKKAGGKVVKKAGKKVVKKAGVKTAKKAGGKVVKKVAKKTVKKKTSLTTKLKKKIIGKK